MISYFYVFHFCFVGSDGTGADTTPRSLSLPGGELEDDVVDDNDGDESDKKTERVRQPFLPSLGDHYMLTAILVKRGIPNQDDDGDDGNDGWHYLLRNDSDNKLKAF